MSFKRNVFISILMISLMCLGATVPKTIKVPIKDKTAKYISISSMVIGSGVYYEDCDSDINAGHRYRAVVTISEVYYSLYIEKIVLDVEGFTTRIAWSKKLDTGFLMDYFKLSSETTSIKDIVFKDSSSFTFLLGEKKVALTVKEKDKDVWIYANL